MGIMFATSESLAGKIQQVKEDYGTKGNMIDCLDAQMRNARKAGLKADVVVLSGAVATGAATKAVKNSKTLQNAILKGFKVLKETGFGKAVGECVSFVTQSVVPKIFNNFNGIKALPGPAKAVLAAGTAITAIALRYISDKSVMKQGEIKQEYKDRAKLQKQLS